MMIFKTIKGLRAYLHGRQSIGFVPTMGALHEGHLALVKRSKKEKALSVCSIFINPTQFNQVKDFEKYPVTIEEDIEKLCSINCDVLFLPSVSEMYPEGLNRLQEYDLGELDTRLEGAFRPGHFNGVCNIVAKLLQAVEPDALYMGEKDFQQCLVIKRLLEITHSQVSLIICPTLREKDGLAMSSRNKRLSETARLKAGALHACLSDIIKNRHDHHFRELQTAAIKKLNEQGFNTEYLALADADNLQLLEEFNADRTMVILIAAVIEEVRLIDNMRF